MIGHLRVQFSRRLVAFGIFHLTTFLREGLKYSQGQELSRDNTHLVAFLF